MTGQNFTMIAKLISLRANFWRSNPQLILNLKSFKLSLKFLTK